ncbi:hypothetical protein [Nitrosomonas communis]|nr:hypothetical protein [Nitrosomonas communis]
MSTRFIHLKESGNASHGIVTEIWQDFEKAKIYAQELTERQIYVPGG